MEIVYQLALIGYTVASPFLFLWFHRNVLKQQWDWDLADKVTVSLYVVSNVTVQIIAYFIEECGGCG